MYVFHMATRVVLVGMCVFLFPRSDNSGTMLFGESALDVSPKWKLFGMAMHTMWANE